MWALDLLEKSCFIVTLAYLFTRAGVLRNPSAPRLSLRDKSLSTVLFLILGLVEVAISNTQYGFALPSSPLNLRIAAVATAGLLGGTSVGLLVGVGVTIMATMMMPGHNGLPVPIAISMVLAGVAGGWLRDLRPDLARLPTVGFLVGAVTSLFRDGLNFLMDYTKATRLATSLEAAALHGAAVFLILFVIKQARDQEAQAKSAQMAEVQALQTRMEPHFLLNSLNLLSALATTDPGLVPTASASLGKYLRASIERYNHPFINLTEELEVVEAFLTLEGLRHGPRLTVKREFESEALMAKIPPFLLQPLVENAITHGIRPTCDGGLIRMTARRERKWLVVTVRDEGIGLRASAGPWLFRQKDGQTHALTLLQRRLAALYGRRFEFSVHGGPGEPTEVVVRVPFITEVVLSPNQILNVPRERP